MTVLVFDKREERFLLQVRQIGKISVPYQQVPIHQAGHLFGFGESCSQDNAGPTGVRLRGIYAEPLEMIVWTDRSSDRASADSTKQRLQPNI